jgi:hypothetical protein
LTEHTRALDDRSIAALMLRASPLFAIARVSLLLASVLIGASARAQPAALDATARRADPVLERYAWQILVADAAGVLAGVAVASSVDVRANRLGVMAATWYGVGALAAPALHYAHGNWPIGLGDLGTRLLLPPVVGFFGLLGACTANRDFEGSCARPGWAVGSMIGLGGWALFDAFVSTRSATGSASRLRRAIRRPRTAIRSILRSRLGRSATRSASSARRSCTSRTAASARASARSACACCSPRSVRCPA